jgi:hypothetical protein
MGRKPFLAGMMVSLLLSGCGRPVASLTPAPSGTPASAPPEGFAGPMPATPNAGDTWVRPADGMVMVCVPAGEFLMGATDAPLATKAAPGTVPGGTGFAWWCPTPDSSAAGVAEPPLSARWVRLHSLTQLLCTTQR